MSNDNGLVDEYEKLQKLREEIDKNLEKLKQEIISLANLKNTNVLFGTSKKCSIKDYEKVIYPKDKTLIIKLIREKGLYDRFSSINYLKLSPAIVKGEIGKEILDLVKKEKAFRLSLMSIKNKREIILTPK